MAASNAHAAKNRRGVKPVGSRRAHAAPKLRHRIDVASRHAQRLSAGVGQHGLDVPRHLRHRFRGTPLSEDDAVHVIPDHIDDLYAVPACPVVPAGKHRTLLDPDQLVRVLLVESTRKLRRVVGSSESEIAGCYALSAAAFRRDDLPTELARRLPRYPIPAAVLGRLAVSSSHRGRGLGEHLLADALHRVMAASSALAIYAVIVDAKNESAKAFYRRYGFQPLPEQPTRLFLPMSTLPDSGTPQDLRIQIKQ